MRETRSMSNESTEGIRICRFYLAPDRSVDHQILLGLRGGSNSRGKPSEAGYSAGAVCRGSFNQFNTGKLGITLNLATPKGLELAKRLIARADVVVDNFAGGAMERMGLGYAELKKIKPDIIMLSSCMQGQTGPHAKHPGSGHKLTALAGFSSITGWPDRLPGNILAYTDFLAPRLNVIGILAALDYRRRTGKGQYLDMSQYENSVHFIAPVILDYVVNGWTNGWGISAPMPHRTMPTGVRATTAGARSPYSRTKSGRAYAG